MWFQALLYPKISLNLGKNHLISYLDVLVECLLNGGIVGVHKLTLWIQNKFSSEFTYTQPAPGQTGLPKNFCRPSGNPWEQLCAASFAPSLLPLECSSAVCLMSLQAKQFDFCDGISVRSGYCLTKQVAWVKQFLSKISAFHIHR